MLHCKFVYVCIYDFFHIMGLYDTLLDPWNVCVYIYIYVYILCVCVYIRMCICVCMVRVKVKCEHYKVAY